MKRSLITLVLSMAALASTQQIGWCGGFPGIGDPHAWSDALPYYNLGNRYLNQERFGEAAQKFQEAIDRYPHDADFHINLGVALRKVEDYGGAEIAFKSALKLNDKDWMAWSDLGNVYLKQNRLKDTIAAFERAMKCNPPSSEKAAMLRDIADIHKILRATGQEPLPQPANASKGKKVASKRSAAPKSLQSKPVNGPAPAPGPAPKPRSSDWGYE